MPTSSTATFSGAVAAGYVSKALLSGETLAGEHITIIPNVKGKVNVQDVTVGTMLQEDSATFSATGSTVISDRALEPRKMKVNRQESKTTLESNYEGEQMKPGALSSDLPQDLSSYIIDLYTSTTAEEVESLIWQGSTTAGPSSQLRFFDGLVTLALADADVIDVPTPVAITESNVVAKIKQAYAMVPVAIRRRKDFTIYVSDNVAEAYTDALAGKSNERYVEDERPLVYKGKKMVSLPGLPDNTIFISRKANLLFGTDLVADFNEVRTIDMAETIGDDVVRYKMRMSGAVQFVYGAQIVLYTTFVPAD